MTDSYCLRCDYDEHVCGGCGEPLKHSEHICDTCRAEHNQEETK